MKEPKLTCAGPYLCRSRCQNLSTPQGETGDVCQCDAAMCYGEEARQRYFWGWRVGRAECEPPPLGRSTEPNSEGFPSREMRIPSTVSQGAWRCHREKMERNSYRRSPTSSPKVNGVTPDYKFETKWTAYAMERIGFPLPRPP